MPLEEQVVSIFSGVRGYLDKIEPAQIVRFEAEFLAHVKSSHPDILSAIQKSGDLPADVETKLHEVTKSFVQSFSA
jgi:F-type H+-transporting ATPase subunit alpha